MAMIAGCPDLAFAVKALAVALAATLGALAICLALLSRAALRRAARHPLAPRRPADPMAAAHGDVPFRPDAAPICDRRVPRFPR
jgi:hypothetical protein